MKSWFMQAQADSATLDLREVPVPEPAEGQLLVRMRAASLNRGEFILGHGLQKTGTSKAIGAEGAGEVVRAGNGVQGIATGDRVMGRCAGAFSEYALMDLREAIRMPEALTYAQGASIPLTFLVVHDMLVEQGRLRAGEWLLVTGVSSGVGVASLQAAKALGARVIGTSGSPQKLERLRAEGLDVGLAAPNGGFLGAVMEATGGKGVSLVVNAVGGTVFAECVRAMAFEGRLATVGYVDERLEATIDLQALHTKRLTLFGVSNKLRTKEQRASGMPGFMRDLMPAIAAGRIRPVIDSTYPFEQLPAARERMDANLHVGKIVLEIA